MSPATKYRSVLERNTELPDDANVLFCHPTEPNPDDQGLQRTVILERLDWEDLGSPDAITVTVEPGDLLNG